jgi:alcohol dehydrogenase class IV
MDHAGLGLIHALSGPLTGYLHLHHGLANALILPYVLRFNLPAIPVARLQRLNLVFSLPVDSSGEALVETLTGFVRQLGLPTHLSELEDSPSRKLSASGKMLDEIDWAAIAEETTRMVLIHNNPRSASVADCEAILAQMR